MKVEKTLESVYLFLDSEEIKPFMLRLATQLFRDDDSYIAAIVLMDEFRLHPNDFNYQRMMEKLEIDNLIHILDEPSALKFSDDLVDVIFPKEVRMVTHPASSKNKLKLARICGFCGDSYVAEKRGHDGCVQPSGV